MYFNFTSEFDLWEKNCTVVSGVVKKPTEEIRCRLIEGENSYILENY